MERFQGPYQDFPLTWESMLARNCPLLAKHVAPPSPRHCPSKFSTSSLTSMIYAMDQVQDQDQAQVLAPTITATRSLKDASKTRFPFGSRASKERSARRAVMGTRVPVRPSTHQHSQAATSRVTRGTVAPCCATPTVSALGHHSAAARIAEARRVSACMTRAPRQGTTKVLTSSNARSTRRASRLLMCLAAYAGLCAMTKGRHVRLLQWGATGSLHNRVAT